jgi:hypothetical protein
MDGRMQINTPLSRFQAWFQRIPLLRSRRSLMVLGSVAIILLILFRILTGSREPQVLPAPGLRSPTGSEGQIELEIIASWPSYPERLSVYRLSSFTPLEQGTQAWATDLGLQPFGTLGRTFTNADRTQTLTVAPENQGVSYSNRFPATEATGVDPELTSIHRDQFLRKLGFSLTDFTEVETLLATEQDDPDEQITVTSPADAWAIQYMLTPTIDQLPLNWEAGGITVVRMVVSNQGVTSATLPNFPFTKETAGEAVALSPEQIEANVEAGNYVIVGTVGLGAERGKLNTLNVERMEPEYRVSTSEQSIKPYLRLSGTGSFQDGKTFPVQITTPLTQ